MGPDCRIKARRETNLSPLSSRSGESSVVIVLIVVGGLWGAAGSPEGFRSVGYTIHNGFDRAHANLWTL